MRRVIVDAMPMIPLAPGKDGKPRAEIDIVQIVKESIAPIKDTLGLTAPLNEKDIRSITARTGICLIII